MHIYPHEFFGRAKYRIDPQMCFVIMPFLEPWSNRTYRILKEIVEDLGFTCVRADEVYGSIVIKDIWRKINEASFIIADLSSKNPNVYYELGIAHVLGKNIIPIIQKGEPIPFDQRPFRVLQYEDNTDGAQILKHQIPKWVNSPDFCASPPIMVHQQAVVTFNTWRKNNLSSKLIMIDEEFSDLDLTGIDFSNTTLSQTEFIRTNLSAASFENSNLIRANLCYAQLNKAKLNNANLSEAILKGTNFRNSSLRNSILLRAQLDNANFEGANIDSLTIDSSTHEKYKELFDNAINKEKIIVER